MKKTIIVVILIGLLIILFIGFLILKKDKKEITVLNEDVCKIESFTLTDNGTEIEVSINSNLTIKKININLYDSNNKKIKTIEKNIGKEIKNNELIKIEDKNQYPEAASTKCVVYETRN